MLLKNELPGKLKTLQEQYPDSKIEVWAQDEARIGLTQHLRRIWALKGEQPTCSSRRVYQWTYVYAYVCPQNGQSTFHLLPTVRGDVFSISLKLLAEEYGVNANNRILLVVDGAGFHRNKDLEVPEGIHLCFLPPYSPELQPVERIWPLLHECHANQDIKDMDTLEDLLCERCVWLSENRDIMKSATHFKWWLNDENI